LKKRVYSLVNKKDRTQGGKNILVPLLVITE
jgi:hypothetical protein